MIIGVIGSGGREHAICAKILESKKIKKLFNRTNIIKNSGHYPMIDNPKKTDNFLT